MPTPSECYTNASSLSFKTARASTMNKEFSKTYTLMSMFLVAGITVKNTMQYKGYVGSVEFSEEDGLFFGKVLGIRSVISYDGKNTQELVEDFHGAVDDYIAMCAAEGITPEKAYKGSFNVRIPAEMHKQAAICALQNNISLNKIVEQALQHFLMLAN